MLELINHFSFVLVSYPLVLYAGAILFGLIVGSFLNVVIYRLPIMMEKVWQEQCDELAGKELTTETPERFNLLTPGSRCRDCGHLIRAWENIPIVSYLIQKGRCSNCGSKISIQYPLIELITAILTVCVVMHFGLSYTALAALFLTWALIALTVIDLQHTLLPDDITLPFLWLGLIISLDHVFISPVNAIAGAVAGYLTLWSVYWLFKLITGKEGMGYGDFKLLAMLGAWLGWQALPAVIVLSSLVGAIVGITMVLFAGHDRRVPIPFGPYLSIAGWIYLLYGDAITKSYIPFFAL